MSKTRINYKSDFSLDVTFAINSAAVPLPTNDYLVRFFIDGAPGTDYVCGYKSGEYINCEKKDDNTITCYIDNHKFGCGRLCCEFIDLEENEKFTDKIQKTVTPSRLDIVLVEGAGDSSTNVSASVLVDVEAVISDLRDALDDIVNMKSTLTSLSYDILKKIYYYDASWIISSSPWSETDFNALYNVVTASSKTLVVARLHTNNSYIVLNCERYQDSNGKHVDFKYIDGDKLYIGASTLSSGVVDVETEMVNFADSDDIISVMDSISDLDGRISGNASAINSQGTRILSLEQWKALVGTAATVVHYVDCDWLDAGSGTLQNYSTLRESILSDLKVLLKNEQTAIYYTVDDTNNVLTVVFFNGTRVDTYTITKGSSGCTVSKTEKNVTTA